MIKKAFKAMLNALIKKDVDTIKKHGAGSPQHIKVRDKLLKFKKEYKDE